MSPNFETMTSKELIAYALAHREEVEPLRVLYNRRSPDSETVWFSPPQSKEEEQQQFELFKKMVKEREDKYRRENPQG